MLIVVAFGQLCFFDVVFPFLFHVADVAVGPVMSKSSSNSSFLPELQFQLPLNHSSVSLSLRTLSYHLRHFCLSRLGSFFSGNLLQYRLLSSSDIVSGRPIYKARVKEMDLREGSVELPMFSSSLQCITNGV